MSFLIQWLGLGVRFPPVPARVGWWERVSEWCMGGNDRFGTCAFAALGNLHALVTALAGRPEVMPEAEIEMFDGTLTGFRPDRAETDHGARIRDVLDYWAENGWPGDPTMKPLGWCRLEPEELALGVYLFGGIYTWLMLPRAEDRSWDWTDAALARSEPGVGAHAVLIVGATADRRWLVSWGQIIQVSAAWWTRYGSDEVYGILHPAWKHPDGFDLATLERDAEAIGQT